MEPNPTNSAASNPRFRHTICSSTSTRFQNSNHNPILQPQNLDEQLTSLLYKGAFFGVALAMAEKKMTSSQQNSTDCQGIIVDVGIDETQTVRKSSTKSFPVPEVNVSKIENLHGDSISNSFSESFQVQEVDCPKIENLHGDSISNYAKSSPVPEANVSKVENLYENSISNCSPIEQEPNLRMRSNTEITKLVQTTAKSLTNVITKESEIGLFYCNNEFNPINNDNAPNDYYGLEQLCNMDSMFIQEEVDPFNCIPTKLRCDFSYNLFHKEISAPIMTIEASSNILGKVIAGWDNLNFLMYHPNDNEDPEEEPSPWLSVECKEIDASDYPMDRNQKGPIVGIISRRTSKLISEATIFNSAVVYPESERFTLTFLGSLDPCSKALLVCGTLVIKRDLFGLAA